MASECMAADVRKERIDPSARIEGQSYIAGELTRIGPGAVIKDSYVQNMVIEAGARVIDSVLTAPLHRSPPGFITDFEARWPAGNTDAICRIGTGAHIEGCSMANTSIGARSRITGSDIQATRIDDDCVIDKTLAQSSYIGSHAVLLGPIEILHSWVGHHAYMDKNTCNGATFTNDLVIVEFDKSIGRIVVKDVLNVPHTSRYGANVICCLYSGLLAPRAHNVFASFGVPDPKEWHNLLPVYGHDRFDPCCWVAGWTQAIGNPRQTPCRSYEDLLTQSTSAHLMPFSVAGLDAGTVSERTIPGELHRGAPLKLRIPAWPFTYAPGAVFEMVKRVHAVAGREIADRIGVLTLRNALAFTECLAHEKGINLAATPASPKTLSGRLHAGTRTITSHLESGLWEFSDGEPVNWTQRNGTWTPRNPQALLNIAADALENQRTEADILRCDQPTFERRIGPSPSELSHTLSNALVSPQARVSEKAFVGPGVRIEGTSVVEDGAWLYRTVVKNSIVGKNSRLLRSVLEDSQIGEGSTLTSTTLIATKYSGKAQADSARAHHCSFSENVRLTPFADVSDSSIPTGAIIGINATNIRGGAYAWLAHSQGIAENLKIMPTTVEVDGTRIELRGTPVFGGGSRILGTPDKPVIAECAFISSNAIIQTGAYVSIGCFVKKGLGPDEGLLPFTLSAGPGPENDRPSEVLFQFPAMVIAVVINTTFQASAPESTPYVKHCVTAPVKEAIAALRWMLDLRSRGATWDASSPFVRYTNMRSYTGQQLAAALHGYEVALADGRWDMEYVDGELRFVGNGEWMIDDFRARFKPRTGTGC